MKELLSKTAWGINTNLPAVALPRRLFRFVAALLIWGFQRLFSGEKADTYVTDRLCPRSP